MLDRGEAAVGNNQDVEANEQEPDDIIVEQLVAGSVNTVALMNTGKVYVLGDNTYH